MNNIKIVKLYADWCAPCKVLERMMRDLDIKHENVNIDSPNGEGLSIKHDVRAIPTLLVLDENDNLIRKMTGLPAIPEDLTKFIYEAN
jgi:thioredoxin 2|nr:MAG TPA: TRX family protein [Crassvirales sp.]